METPTLSKRNADGFGLSAFPLKLIAALTMLCDHIGAYLLPEIAVLRIIGRLAFPIYAYFIAEGCRYTRNKLKRFLLVLGLAVLCEAAYFVTSKELTGTALVTFSCSIPMIYAVQALKQALAGKHAGRTVLALAFLTASVGVTVLVGHAVPMDYGIPGAFLPVLLAIPAYVPGKAPEFLRAVDCRAVRLCVFAVGLLMVWWLRGGSTLQLYSLLALLPMAFYNGRPGTKKFKYGFYIFYPAHLLIIWVIGLLMNG